MRTPFLETVFWLVFNFVSSIGIVFVNKIVFNHGFTLGISLTAFHFLVTFLGMEASRRCHLFNHKSVRISEMVPICGAFMGFVVFNNLSLQFNSAAFYQIMKVLTTPVIVLIEKYLYATNLPQNKKVALFVICLGVTLATVHELEFNPSWMGIGVALCGVLATSFYQIWIKTEQKRLELDHKQLLYAQAPLSFAMLTLAVPVLDAPLVDRLVEASQFGLSTWSLVVLSGVLAFFVNLSIFMVVSKTTPISYNVLGHLKLVTIVVSSFFLFGTELSYLNLLGCFFAVVGAIRYSLLNLK